MFISQQSYRRLQIPGIDQAAVIDDETDCSLQVTSLQTLLQSWVLRLQQTVILSCHTYERISIHFWMCKLQAALLQALLTVRSIVWVVEGAGLRRLT